ncbi:MAG: transketolase [Alphaproteobacteria bacterium]|jgi:transketolase|nr:transketolase [Alphaproteobacteria bacterium]
MDPLCKRIRSEILSASHKSGHGHIPTSFSIVEMLFALYSTMRHDPKRPDMAERDIFILSKGHASLGFYCVLAASGYFGFDEVASFGAYQSKFGCHPDRMKVPGVEASTGSLGHGIGLAVGVALAAKISGSPRRVYTLIGDGESNEGSVWEAIMVATNLKLDNLTVLYDHNHSQERSLPIPNPAERFRAFGCDVVQVPGHDVAALKGALATPAKGVRVIVADTVKGHGCRTMIDNVYEWHRKSPKADELVTLMGELDAAAV